MRRTRDLARRSLRLSAALKPRLTVSSAGPDDAVVSLGITDSFGCGTGEIVRDLVKRARRILRLSAKLKPALFPGVPETCEEQHTRVDKWAFVQRW